MTTQLKMTTLDCSDPRAEATFWSTLLGWDVAVAEDEYAMVVPAGGGAMLGFGRVEDHQRPGWPNERGTKQFHLDLACDDVAASEEQALALGATLAEPQPGDTWRVLLDPAGHPFCLTDAARW
jgi:predicted enzyme related to lactoylglutathione lyase